MLLLKIHLLPTDSNQKDDEIEFTRPVDSPHEMIAVRYTPGKGTAYRFWLNRRDVREYIDNLLVSLTHDTDPFDKFQFTPSIGPAILYHVADLDDSTVRHTIAGNVYMLFITDIEVSR